MGAEAHGNLKWLVRLWPRSLFDRCRFPVLSLKHRKMLTPLPSIGFLGSRGRTLQKNEAQWRFCMRLVYNYDSRKLLVQGSTQRLAPSLSNPVCSCCLDYGVFDRYRTQKELFHCPVVYMQSADATELGMFCRHNSRLTSSRTIQSIQLSYWWT